jgi:hypothetical protein
VSCLTTSWVFISRPDTEIWITGNQGIRRCPETADLCEQRESARKQDGENEFNFYHFFVSNEIGFVSTFKYIPPYPTK